MRFGRQAPALAQRQLQVLLDARSGTALRQHLLDSLDDEAAAEGLIRQAADALVLPALAPVLDACLPNRRGADEPRSLAPGARLLVELASVAYDQNGRRNRGLLDEYETIDTRLRAHGIVNQPLKGLHWLLEADTDDPLPERVVSDLDLQVAEGDLAPALQQLRILGYHQQANRYAVGEGGGDTYRPLDPADFRNRPQFVDSHVPRLWLPGHASSVELHLHVTHRRSRLRHWLDQQVTAPASPLFHLMHNFDHSHCKDRQGDLGLVDWRHLLDSVRALAQGEGRILSAAMVEVAARFGLDDSMAVHLWQLDTLLGVPQLRSHWDRRAHRRAIRRFEYLRSHADARQRRQRSAAVQRALRSSLSPRVLRERYGPMPWHRQLRLSWRFYREQWARRGAQRTS